MATLQLVPLQDTLVGGKYRLGEVIGSGGVGTVYRATHLWTEREVAVKVLDPSLPHFEQLRDAFLREARATVQLEHPNVVDVLDMGEDDLGTTYMVMELLDGPTLRDVLLEQGRLSERDTAMLLLPLVDALEKAHALGIVHKDFKPENIILSVDSSGSMTPKLLDFGVAQLVRDSEPRRRALEPEVIVGTPQYMSPEQARDQRHLIGPQTDVWGVGVVWYECLSGRCPFDGDTPIDVLKAVCEAPVDFTGIEERLAIVLRTALERSATRRTPSLAMLRRALEASSGSAYGAPLDPRRPSSRPPGAERPSYVRRTLRDRDPSRAVARSVQLDSELLALPKASHRRAALGGLALAVAVGLAAWWTIDGTRTEAPPARALPEPAAEPASLPVAVTPVEPERPAPALEERPAPVEIPEAPVAESPIATDPSPTEEGAEGLLDPAPSAVQPPPAKPFRESRPPAPSEPKATKASTAPAGSRRGSPEPSPERATYPRPPELVTEW